MGGKVKCGSWRRNQRKKMKYHWGWWASPRVVCVSVTIFINTWIRMCDWRHSHMYHALRKYHGARLRLPKEDQDSQFSWVVVWGLACECREQMQERHVLVLMCRCFLQLTIALLSSYASKPTTFMKFNLCWPTGPVCIDPVDWKKAPRASSIVVQKVLLLLAA